MLTNTQRLVDYNTKQAERLLDEAIEVRKTMPPLWKWRDRRKAKRRYRRLMALSQQFVDRAARL